MKEELYNAIAVKCMDWWMQNRENKKFIHEYLRIKGIKRVGIYGYGIFGKHLVTELQNTDVNIEWVMDKRDLNPNHKLKIVHIDEKNELSVPELIIVTSIRFFEEIEKDLIEAGYNNIQSIEEIIEVVYSWKKD